MSLPDWNAFLKADAAIAALVGNRIYPLLIPHHVYNSVTQHPVIVFQRIGAQRTANYCGTERIVVASYQFDCYARRYETTLELAEAVRLALRDYVGLIGDCRIRLMRQETEIELLDPEPGLFRVSSDWSVWYIEGASETEEPPVSGDVTADSSLIFADSTLYTADAS